MFNRLEENPQPSPPEFSVYNGRDCIGRAVECQPKTWTAFTADDELIGTFPARKAAIDAIISATK
jgi:hypothetical protein